MPPPPLQSFPTPGMLEHTLMMGGQLSLGGKWKCLPLRDVGIAKFMSKCRRLTKLGTTEEGLYEEALELLNNVDVADVPASLLRASFLASLSTHEHTTPLDLVNALTLTQLTWHSRPMLIAFQAEPYVVTDVLNQVTHIVSHIVE